MKVPLESVCKFYNAMCRGYLYALIPHISNEPMSGTLSTQPLDDPRKACHSNMSPEKTRKIVLEIWYFEVFWPTVRTNCSSDRKNIFANLRLITYKIFEINRIGILLPKLFWPTVRKNCSSDREIFWNSRLKAENLQNIWDH